MRVSQAQCGLVRRSAGISGELASESYTVRFPLPLLPHFYRFFRAFPVFRLVHGVPHPVYTPPYTPLGTPRHVHRWSWSRHVTGAGGARNGRWGHETALRLGAHASICFNNRLICDQPRCIYSEVELSQHINQVGKARSWYCTAG